MSKLIAPAVVLFPVLLLSGCSIAEIAPDRVPPEWQTRAEQTDYAQTARYDEVVDFCRRLARSSPNARYTSFGRSGEGRALPLLILSSSGDFTPKAARRSGKPLFLIQNCIHAGEVMGKDACLALSRDILITRTRADLLDHVNVLIIPIFNTDGHERFSPYSRINQNGPAEMGWRVTAANLNLNRDYAKADSVEMQAWLRLWNRWQPDLYYDEHTTDGSDHQYHLMYAGTTSALVAQPIVEWMQKVLYPGLWAPLAADDWNTIPYSGPVDRSDISKGINGPGGFSPRFSTGYAAVCNRPSLLVETHALKPYRERVQVTYDLLVATLKTLNRDPESIRRAIRAADQQCIDARGGERDGRVPLRLERTEHSAPITYKAVRASTRPSAISGADVIEYGDQRVDVRTRFFDEFRVATAVTPPAAYLVPPQWTEVIERLELHGIEMFRLQAPIALPIESYQFEDVKFAPLPYEGRQIPRYKTIPTSERREFVAGTVVVPMDQRRAKLAAHLLEPEAPDALVAWGLLNTIFEQKEYFESYAMEPIARRMLEANPALRAEFEQKLKTDEKFAKSPGARLFFFYQRSPYYDQRHNVYPVARLTDPAQLEELRGH